VLVNHICQSLKYYELVNLQKNDFDIFKILSRKKQKITKNVFELISAGNYRFLSAKIGFGNDCKKIFSEKMWPKKKRSKKVKFWFFRFIRKKLVIILVKNTNLDHDPNFGQKLKLYSKNRNVTQKSKFWSKIEIIVKTRNFSQNSKFYSKNRNLAQKSKL